MKIVQITSQDSIQKDNEFFQALFGVGIPLQSFIPETDKNNLKVKVHRDLEECHQLWNQFSPMRSLNDTWEFRYAWYQGYPYPLWFYTVYEGKKPLALLPLWYSTDDKRFEWFGGAWMEDNTFLVKDESLVSILIRLLPQNALLSALDGNFLSPAIISQFHFLPDLPKFIKNIKSCKTAEEYFSQLPKKHRYNLKRDANHIELLSPTVTVVTEKKDEILDRLVSMNVKRFDGVQREKSSFSDPETALCYRHILHNEGVYKIIFIEVTIQGATAAIDMIICYNNIYYPWIGANNIQSFPGIGSYMLSYEIQDAIQNGYAVIDCSQGDHGWKHRYLDVFPLYKYSQ